MKEEKQAGKRTAPKIKALAKARAYLKNQVVIVDILDYLSIIWTLRPNNGQRKEP